MANHPKDTARATMLSKNEDLHCLYCQGTVKQGTGKYEDFILWTEI
jgi:hypothetical protein